MSPSSMRIDKKRIKSLKVSAAKEDKEVSILVEEDIKILIEVNRIKYQALRHTVLTRSLVSDIAALPYQLHSRN